MANLRVVYDNALIRNDSLTASAAQGSLTISNVLTDTKSQVYRCATTTAGVTVTWPAAEVISCVAIPFSNLTIAATIRVKLYDAETGGNVLYDLTSVACPDTTSSAAMWANQPKGVNSFAYGGGLYALAWVPRCTGVRRAELTISDAANPAGYIEFASLVIGDYWEPDFNVEWGDVSVGTTETTKQNRSESGDLRIDKGVMYKTMSLKLGWMSSNDKAVFWRIMRGNGLSNNVFLSTCPVSTDPNEVQVFCIYGKLSQQAMMAYTFVNQFTSSMDIEEC